MENSEYLSLQIEKIRVEHQPPTITLQSASSSSFDMGTGRRPWSLSSLFLGPPFFVEKKGVQMNVIIIPKTFHL